MRAKSLFLALALLFGFSEGAHAALTCEVSTNIEVSLDPEEAAWYPLRETMVRLDTNCTSSIPEAGIDTIIEMRVLHPDGTVDSRHVAAASLEWTPEDLAGLLSISYIATETNCAGSCTQSQGTAYAKLYGAVIDGPEKVRVGDTVELSGLKSWGEGNLSYEWTLVSKPTGSAAHFVDPSIGEPSFVADVAGEYVVRLSIQDSIGQTSSVQESGIASDVIAIITAPEDAAVNESIALDGSRSNGEPEPLSFEWTMSSRPEGSGSGIVGGTQMNASFVPDRPGTYTVTLRVENGFEEFDTATHSILVTEGEVEAVIYAPIFGVKNQTNIFDGSESTGEPEPLSYSWSIIESPPGSSPSLRNSSFERATLYTSTSGLYKVQLAVTNHSGKVDTAVHEILVLDELDPLLNELRTPINVENCTIKACGEPINIATGAHWHKQTDFSLRGRTPETELSFIRSYAAHSFATNGDFGLNWRHNWETSLVQDGQDIFWIDENGGPWQFLRQQDGSFLSPVAPKMTLTEFEDHFELVKHNKTKLLFSKGVFFGRLLKLVDKRGEEINFGYMNGRLSSISGVLAGTIRIERNEEGRIFRVIRERDNLAYTYSYTPEGRLATATDFAGLTYEFTYVNNMPGTVAQGMLSTIRDPIGRVMTTTYYPNGRAYQQFEAGGGVRTFVYGEEGGFRFTDVTEIDGQTTRYFFDSNYRTIKEVLPDGSIKLTSWDLEGNIASTTDELGLVTEYGYDENGNRTSIKRPEDPSPTLLTYDLNFNVITSITPLAGAPTSFSLNEFGDVIGMQRGNLSLSFTRDAFGNLLETNNGRSSYSNQTDANGLVTQVFDLHNLETLTYDSRFRVATRSFASGRVLNFQYDNYDRVVQVTDSHGPTVQNQYDAMGRLVKRTVTDGKTRQATRFEWDAHDRLVAEINAKGERTARSYDEVRVIPEPKSVTDAKGNTVYFEYDSRQRLVKQIDALGAETTFGYSPRGERTLVVDANGNQTRFLYDGNGRKVQETRATAISDGTGHVVVDQVIKSVYDSGDRLVREEKVSASGGNSRVTVYQYDEFDRLVRKKLQREDNGVVVLVEDDSVYSYEPQLDAELMKTAVNGNSILNFASETAPPFAKRSFVMNPGQSGLPIQTVDLELDRDVTGNISAVRAESGNLIFTKKYDPAGRLIGVKAGTYKLALAYDGYGRKNRLASSDGAAQTIEYDPLNRVREIVWTKNYQKIFQQNLNYDKAGNPHEISYLNGRYDLSYDANNQLVGSRTEAGAGFSPYNRDWNLDALGNRLNDSVRGQGQFVANFQTRDGEGTYQADTDGFGELIKETLKDGTIRQFTYRTDGRIASVQDNKGTSAEYHYDALGRVIGKTISASGSSFSQLYAYLADERTVLYSVNGAGEKTLHVDGQGVNEHLFEIGSSPKTYITDHLGSVVNSEIAATMQYGLYGEVLGKDPSLSANSPALIYGFAGYEYDSPAGNYRMDWRSYFPGTGRFLSQEPTGADGPNLYWYARNNPLRYTDPTGEISEEIVSQYTSPGLQAGIGAAEIAAGIAIVKAATKIPACSLPSGAAKLALLGLGGAFIYDGGKNVVRGGNRLASRYQKKVKELLEGN